MRWIYHFALLAAELAGCGTQDTDRPDPTLGPVPAGDTVDRVEVPQYVGTWYEIASIRMGFQANCRNTTAVYGVIDDQTVSVLNRCDWGANPVELDGIATIVDPTTNARLEVDFGFDQAPYWIVDLGVANAGEPYPWAVVSSPQHESLWLLSRTAVMPGSRFDAVLARLEERGYGPERMELTEQER